MMCFMILLTKVFKWLIKLLSVSIYIFDRDSAQLFKLVELA